MREGPSTLTDPIKIQDATVAACKKENLVRKSVALQHIAVRSKSKVEDVGRRIIMISESLKLNS